MISPVEGPAGAAISEDRAPSSGASAQGRSSLGEEGGYWLGDEGIYMSDLLVM